ncbi:MAG: restriction endonuclease subunit S, partial [Saprospiraceae bacterium]
SGYKFINVLDILNNEFLTHDKIIGSVDVTKDIVDRYPVNYGDILFQRSSETREDVGSACVYLDNNNTATFGGFVIRGRKIGEYNPVFLNKLLKTDSARDSITSKSGGSTRFNVGQETLSTVDLLLPSLPEQQKIADFLTSVDAKISHLKKKKEALEKYKKGVTQQVFSQELRFKSDDGSEYPDWEEKKLGANIEFLSGIAFKGYEISENSKGTPILRGINITEGAIRHTTQIDRYYIGSDVSRFEKYIVEENDLVIGMDGSKVGKNVALIKKDDAKSILIQRVARIRASKKADIHFIYQNIFSKKFHDYVDVVNTSSGIPHISAQQIKDFKIKFPIVNEQTKIANFLSAIDEKIQLVQGQVEKMEVWKKGLLQKMFV